jgi:pyrrolidone-carboxylate peptidase
MKAHRLDAKTPSALGRGTLLQRKCRCGTHTIAGGECAECQGRKPSEPDARARIDDDRDGFEGEADRIADRVVGMSETPAGGGPAIRARRLTGAGSTAAVPASVERTLASSGRPLAPAVRREMERRFGHDFTTVRVHTGALAEQSARDVEAHAYTAGTRVVFGAGHYAPHTPTGRRLLAHELAHVVQQGGAALHPGTSGGRLQREKAPQPAPSGTCQSATLADTFKPTNTWGGKAWDPTLGPKEFGTTSKLAANFGFGACKEGGVWKFHLNKLEVMVASKVQPKDFRINVDGASDAAVTEKETPTILADLRPNRTVTFRPGCGDDKYDDKVTTYSRRATYWNYKLVEEHEAFHRKEWTAKYRAELVKGEARVRSHTIPEADAADASAAVAKARPQLEPFVIGAYQDACKVYSPTQESDAYDDGAPAYQKLVDEIKARAVKEKWIPAAAGGGSGQLLAPDVIPMPSEADAGAGEARHSPTISSDRDAAVPSVSGGSRASSDGLADKLTAEHGGLKQKLPLTRNVVGWVNAQRSGRTEAAETDPEAPLADNDPSKYTERRHEGDAFVWGETDRRAIDKSDVQQGYLGDCYFMALLAAIAEVRPEAIEQMVTPNDDGTFTVKFFGPDGKRVNQTVTPTFPSYASGTPAYGQPGDQSDVYGKELWPMLIEKAWMQAHGSWLAIEGGKIDTKQHAIAMTGSVREDMPMPGRLSDDALFLRLSRHFQARQPATVFSPKASAESKKKVLGTGVILNHAYALSDVHSSGKTIDLYNPHGPTSDHLLAKSMSFLRANFRQVVLFTLGNRGLSTTPDKPTAEEQRAAEAVPQEILKGSGYDQLVAAFEKDLPLKTSAASLRDAVVDFGTKLWEQTKARAQDRRKANTDDRPLYWARLAGATLLRAFVPSGYTVTPVEKQALLDTLEASSRGRTSIEFTAKGGAKSRRVLVSGFDPFGFGGDLRKANPSGAAVLALDGQVVPSAPGGTDGRVEGVIFPVRFADFDRGIVETTFRPFLSNPARRVDMVMTISQGGSRLKPGASAAAQSKAFELERYAGRRRAPSGPDNTGADPARGGGLTVGKRLGEGPEFLESSLPRAAMSGRKDTPDETERSEIDGKAAAGSGGGFLSNEIFYRTALLRADEKSTVPVGHLHVPYQPAPTGTAKSEKEHSSLRDRIVARVKKLIANALKSMGRMT